MAENYRVTQQDQTIQQIASGQVIDVVAVDFQTLPHRVSAQVLVPLKAWEQGKTAKYAEPVATGIEKLMAEGLATSGHFVDDVDPATDLRTNYVEFVVSYTGPQALGASSVRVKVPVSELAGDVNKGPAEALKRAKSALEHTAGL